MFEESFFRVAGVVLGQKTASKISDDRIITKQVIDDLLKYYHYKPVEIPKNIKTHEEQLNYCLRPHGIMRRQIVLEEKWWKDAFGPVLAYTRENGDPVALLPSGFSGYCYLDRESGRKVKLNTKTAAQFEREGYCFYKPFPQKKLGIPDLMLYMKNCLSIHPYRSACLRPCIFPENVV